MYEEEKFQRNKLEPLARAIVQCIRDQLPTCQNCMVNVCYRRLAIPEERSRFPGEQSQGPRECPRQNLAALVEHCREAQYINSHGFHGICLFDYLRVIIYAKMPLLIHSLDLNIASRGTLPLD